jgi:WD40 repeat protein
VRAYDSETGQELFPDQAGHTGQVWSVAFNQDASLLASGGDDRMVRIWDLAGRRNTNGQPPVHVLAGHMQQVWSVRFSPDSKLLASGSLDRTIALWDVQQRKRLRTVKGHSSTYSRIAFSPDGRTIAGGQENGAIKFWDVGTGQDKDFMRAHHAAVRCVAYSPDGKLLASAGVDKMVQVHNTEDRRLVRELPMPAIVDQVAFSADGKLLVATTDANNPSTLNVWDVATWKESSYPSHASHTPGLAMSPTGRFALTSGYDKTVRFWDLRAGAEVVATFGPGPFGALPASPTFTPDGRYWATGNQNGTITILRTPERPQ